MVSVLVAVDPAVSKDHAWSIFVHGKLKSAVLDKSRYVDELTIVVVEDQFVGRNSQSALDLAKSAGHLVAKLGRGIQDVIWTKPLEWKRKLVAGAKSPKPPKDVLEEYAIHKALLKILDDDELGVYNSALAEIGSKAKKLDLCDSIGIGLAHLNRTL